MPGDRVLLAAPRGCCAGVEMAIKALAWMVRAFDPPVYCYHEIVHFFFQAEDGIRDGTVTGVQTCALPISGAACRARIARGRARRPPDRGGGALRDPARDRGPGRDARAGARGPPGRRPSPPRGRARARSEERRVGKECRSRWSTYQ